MKCYIRRGPRNEVLLRNAMCGGEGVEATNNRHIIFLY